MSTAVGLGFGRISSNPKTANCNPASFNRLARLLHKYVKTAPEDVPVHPRQPAKRPQVTALLLGSGNSDPGPADPKQFGWSICPQCSRLSSISTTTSMGLMT